MGNIYMMYAASLHIDVENYNKSGQKERTYIGDEKDLRVLFDKTESDRISKLKLEEYRLYKEDKESIFVRDVKKENIVLDYQKDLFLTESLLSDSHSIGIDFSENTKPPSLAVIVCIAMAFILMTVYVISYIYKRRSR